MSESPNALRIDFNMLEIGDEVFRDKEPFRTFLYLGHDHFPLLQCGDEYALL
jgi:hypothetical protein